jgi:3-oxoacyl-[acyl-carrier protein] reductase
MDFGLRGRTAIVCAASMGLGRSCAVALGGEGVKLVIVARRREILEHAADEIRAATGAETVAVVADVTTQDGRDAILSACPNPDILINNAGGPPPGDFRNWDRGDWIKALDANMLAPIELMKSTIDSMIARKFGRIVNITSHAVKGSDYPMARARVSLVLSRVLLVPRPSTMSPSTICCRARSIPTR